VQESAVTGATPRLPAGLKLVELRRIEGPSGAVLHAMKASDTGFEGFGEAYFTTVGRGQVKAWKRHRTMVSNLIVPVGEICLKLLDDRPDSLTYGRWFEVTLGPMNYQRLTVPPGFWMGFKGIAEDMNLMLNIASAEHDPNECDTLPQSHPQFALNGW
jgi:dTDP-4-dehydrorhamnose 3,5-epimerase